MRMSNNSVIEGGSLYICGILPVLMSLVTWESGMYNIFQEALQMAALILLTQHYLAV